MWRGASQRDGLRWTMMLSAGSRTSKNLWRWFLRSAGWLAGRRRFSCVLGWLPGFPRTYLKIV